MRTMRKATSADPCHMGVHGSKIARLRSYMREAWSAVTMMARAPAS